MLNRLLPNIIMLIVLAVLGLVAWLLLTLPVQAHEATPTAAQPEGWTYPIGCCSGIDCRKINYSTEGGPVTIHETSEGYRFNTSDEVVPYNDPRVRESPDGEFHWCTQAGADDGRTICLYVPPRGF